MLSDKVIDFLKGNGWWFDEVSVPYKVALESIGISAETQIGFFYLHAEAGPEFFGEKGAMHQLCWFIINTDYVLGADSLRKSLGIPPELIPLDSFEGGGGSFYNSKNGQVVELCLGQSLIDYLNDGPTKSWDNFNSYLEYFFGL
ncbi:hypothetical protein [Shewanella khirikhana]|uniref:SMI1 / KNR4 family protein n=1 Tax=Shewanella khirikhana TaxID=1965282 RepID=A0ABM7DPA6_9GAMM|nr:hypothetical protein [Shewanella khirikhana]AZQ11501.1 hypothetical protein STH12_02423 [Shewanella khirikhana]